MDADFRSDPFAMQQDRHPSGVGHIAGVFWPTDEFEEVPAERGGNRRHRAGRRGRRPHEGGEADAGLSAL